MPAHSRGYRRIFHTWPQRGPAPKASKHQRRQATPRHPGRAINREGWASDYRQMGATPLPACGHRSPLGPYVSLRPWMVIAAETPTSLLQSWIQTHEPRVMPGPGQASVWAAIRDLVVDACPAVSPFCPLEGTSAFAQASAFPSPVSPAGMKGAGGRGTCPSHAPGAEGRRLSQGQAAPGTALGQALSHGRQELLSCRGHPASSPRCHLSRPCQGQHHPLPSNAALPHPLAGAPPAPGNQSKCCAHHPLRPPRTGAATIAQGGGESPDSCARKTTLPVPDPHCPRPCHGCHHPHAGARGSEEPTAAMGARGSRASARGPVGPATARPGHCASGHAARTAPAPGAPLTSRPPQSSARRRRHLHPGLPEAPIH